MVDAQDADAADHVEDRHDGYDLFGERRDTAHAAQEDEARDHRADHADDDLGRAERSLKRAR